jgi:D-3-phosphoglycerate dehydrogenase
MKVMVTCPPMLRRIDNYRSIFAERGIELTTPEVVQTLSVEELKRLVPEHDGWIIGDDPAERSVFEAGRAGRLKAAVKWGIGVDNVDFAACSDLGIPIINTPNMFGGEVADVAVGYVIGLARELFLIDRSVRNGGWVKPTGISLSDKTVALLGFGDIGRNVAKRLIAAGMKIIAYDPGFTPADGLSDVGSAKWPDRLPEADFIVITCALTASSRHMLNADTLALAKQGVRVVNVARGPIIDEVALCSALESGKVHSVALDVFEFEPLPATSPLRQYERSIFGAHNASNTADAVDRTSLIAIDKLCGFLGLN